MWIATFHRFTSRAAFLAACDEANWPRDEKNNPAPPANVSLDIVGQHIAPPQIVNGEAQPGEVLDARFHVNAAWHGIDPPDAFTAAAITPATPSRAFALPPPAPPIDPPVPQKVPGWKGRIILDEAGLLATAKTRATGAGSRVARALNEADTWTRDSVFVNQMATALGLSKEQVDQMFRDADAIPS